jgi:hypothetical protein
LWRAKRGVGFVIEFVVRNGFDVVWFGVFLSRLWRMERAQRDVGFVIRCGWMWMVFGFFGWVWGFCRRLWRVKRDVGFGIRGLWWKMDPSPGPGP